MSSARKCTICEVPRAGETLNEGAQNRAPGFYGHFPSVSSPSESVPGNGGPSLPERKRKRRIPDQRASSGDMSLSPTEETDILIAGAGPAGCAAGVLLARKGFRVSILEKHSASHHKICRDLVPEREPAPRRHRALFHACVLSCLHQGDLPAPGRLMCDRVCGRMRVSGRGPGKRRMETSRFLRLFSFEG